MGLNVPHALCLHSTPYYTGTKQRELERKEIEKMLEAVVAEPAVTKSRFSFVFILKKDRNLRFCANNCRLSAVTMQNSTLIPRSYKGMDLLGQ